MPTPRPQSEAKRMAALAGLITQTRNTKGWSQKQLAEALPLSQTTLSRYENGVGAIPPDETIILIAEALDANPVDFLRVAGRLTGETFENAVMDKLAALEARIDRIDQNSAATHALLVKITAQAQPASRELPRPA